MKSLVPSTSGLLALKPSVKPLVLYRSIEKYCRGGRSEEGEKSHDIGEKARSTAEEFRRQAKEKAESMMEGAKEAWDNAKEAIVGETRAAKDKFKENVEKGDYDHMGKD